MGWTQRRRGAALGAALLTVLLASGCTAGSVDPFADYEQVATPMPDDVSTRLQAVLDQAVTLSGSSGGVAAAWAPWGGEWSGASGTVSFAEGAPKVDVTADVQLSTVTSEMTCALLLRLVDAGVVELDDEVGEHARGFPGLDGITLEQLCRHTSGLADYYGPLRSHFIANPERVWPAGELVASGLAASRVGPPGAQVSFSRTGILLLAIALEQTTDQSFSALVDQYVLAPLDLDDTRFPAAADDAHEGTLAGYAVPIVSDPVNCEARVDLSTKSSSMGGAAGAAVADLDDLHRLSVAFANGSLLSEDTARAQWTTTPVGGSTPIWISQGIGGVQLGPLRGLAGEMPGALTAAYTDPSSGLSVVIALNSSTSGAEFVQQAAMALASAASKTPTTGATEQPLIELPWSIEQATTRMQELAICPLPAPAG